MADQVTEVEAALSRSKAARGVTTNVSQLKEAMGRVDSALRAPATVEEYAPPDERDRLAALEQTITGPEKRLERLAMLLCTLNFGEMMEHCKGTGGEAQKVWDWAVAYLAKDMEKEEPK